MLLSVRELEIFRHVMEAGGITAAALQLGITQPAVSKMLQQAEERLGFRLFTRLGRRLRPTTEAQALFPEALNAFAALEVVQRLAGDLRDGRSGTLNVAVIPSLANSVVPLAVQRFRAARPDVGVILHTVTAGEVVRLVADQQADLGALIGPAGGADVRLGELCTTELGCLLPPGHPLLAKPALGPADLAGHPLISAGGRWPLGALLTAAFAEANIPLKIAIEVPQATVSGALVRAGAGIAVLDGFGLMGARGSDLLVRPFRPRVLSVARLLQPRYRQPSRLALAFRDDLLTAVAQSGFTVTRPPPARAARAGKRDRAPS